MEEEWKLSRDPIFDDRGGSLEVTTSSRCAWYGRSRVKELNEGSARPVSSPPRGLEVLELVCSVPGNAGLEIFLLSGYGGSFEAKRVGL